jgi:hypothetical protein
MAAPVRPSAGDMADSAFWTAENYDRWVNLYDAWQTYTPVWSTSNATQPAIVNGTLTGRFKAIGKTVWFSLRFLSGTSTTYGDGLWSFSLPPGLIPTTPQSVPGVVSNSSAGRYPVTCWLASTGGVLRIILPSGGSAVRTNPPTGNAPLDVPFDWIGANNQIILGGVYEAN